jgi:RES domain-containing protein
MRLWRLSSERRARVFDGGHGIWNDGRWNSRGRPVTYCSTVPSPAALEKRVHVTDAALLPPQVIVAYELHDGISTLAIDVKALPTDWTARVTYMQAIGDKWLDSMAEALLFVPCVMMPITDVPIAMC